MADSFPCPWISSFPLSRGRLSLLGAVGLVGGGVQQLLLVGDALHLHQPGAVGVGVDGLGGVQQVLVDRLHRAGDGAVDVGDGLHRLHISQGLAAGEGVPHLGQVDKDQVPQGVLGVVGEAHLGGAVVGEEDPLVGLGVAEMLRGVHDKFLLDI